MTCDHVVAATGDYDGGVEFLRQSTLQERIASCHASRLAWAEGKYTSPKAAEEARAETPVESFLRFYVVCRFCPECGAKLPELP